MKMLLTAISAVATLNLLAMGGLVGYLAATGRIDARRLTELRESFAETIAERDAREAAAEAAAEAERLAAEQRAKEAQAPVPTADILATRLEHNQADIVRLEAIRREVEILQETLRRERRALDEEKASLKRDRQQFEQARRIVMQTEGDSQFRKALATYEALKPDRAQLAFAQLIEQGEIDQVVAYLNAMQERTRTKLIDEFLREDPAVATDLLERLRVRGISARTPESSG